MIWYSLTEDQRITKTKALRKNRWTTQTNVSPKMLPSPLSESKNSHSPSSSSLKFVSSQQKGGEDTMNAHTNFKIFKNSPSLSSTRLSESLRWLLLHLFDSELRQLIKAFHQRSSLYSTAIIKFTLS